MPDFVTCRQTMLLYLKARIPFISLRTDERDRALELFRCMATDLNVPIYHHTLSQGVRDIATNRVVNEDRSVAGALDYASQQILQRQNLTFVLTEVQDIDGDTPISRQMLDVASSATERGGSIVVITTSSIWPRLQRQGMTLVLDPPNEDEMRAIIAECLSPYRGSVQIEWGEPELTEAATILAGVTRIEAENAVATFLAKGSILKSDLAELSKVKDRIFSDIAGLERVKTSAKEVTVGGLAGLQAWLEKQRPLLNMDLRERGLRPPRGVLLVGVPGCGKSLSAKAIATSWNLPLYRLDLSNIHGQYLGQSEGRLKEALSTADRVAPCVLWIDEIEKGLSGTRGQTGDSGTSTRVFGTLLTWMEENEKPVFTIATANDIEGLPPELLRKGRFDEVFFIDLPTPQERANILAIHITKHHRDYRDFDLPALVVATEGFSGAEIEQAVVSSLYRAFGEGEETKLENRHLASALSESVPLSRSMANRVAILRQEAKEKWRPASNEPETGPVKDVGLAEPPPVPKKVKRVFDV